MDQEPGAAAECLTLTSQLGTPAAFTIEITGAGPKCLSRSFRVTGTDPATGSLKSRTYRLSDTQQNAYLDLFEALARDFGTRTPRNRQVRDVPDVRAPFRVLLTESMSPDVLYGFGDPAVTRVTVQGAGGREDTWYYLLVTSNDAPHSFPILRSRNLSSWELVGFVFPKGKKPDWALDGELDGELISDFWAPELHEIGGVFLVCFAAREKNGALAIGIAKSPRPDGPFVPMDAPLLSGGVIDPHILVDQEGGAFLFWKEDTNDLWPSRLNQLLFKHSWLIAELFPSLDDQRSASFLQALWPWVQGLEPMERFFVQQVLVEATLSDFLGFQEQLAGLQSRQSDASTQSAIGDVLRLMRTPVYGQRLAPDGSSLLGEKTAVLENDQEWEGHLVEGVWVAQHDGKYYLLYSGNDFSTVEYGIGVAVADAPLGPYRKVDEPLLRSTADWLGPGHPSVAIGPDGEPWMFLHAFFPERIGYKAFRALLTVPITFQADGVELP